MARHVVGKADAIGPGERLVAEIAGRKIVIFNLGGEFFGLHNRCPHQGGALCEGRVTGLVEPGAGPGDYRYSRQGEILRCPWHGWEFDIRTGLSRTEPSRIRTRAYAVDVVEGEALEAPLRAETVPVMLEESYLVVDI
jgi:3-phenylpropionate/trans-cinnamate dioxygenase ferredoxin subunit